MKKTIVLNAFGCTKIVDVDADVLKTGVLILPYPKHDRPKMLENLLEQDIILTPTNIQTAYFKFHGECDELNRPIFYFNSITT